MSSTEIDTTQAVHGQPLISDEIWQQAQGDPLLANRLLFEREMSRELSYNPDHSPQGRIIGLADQDLMYFRVADALGKIAR